MEANAAPPAAKALTHRETMLIVLGVLLPVFMGSLDGTILASALPSIGRELGDVHNLPWLITAYLIANTSVTTLYGKISDIHGRRTTLIISISMYMLGSLVCALAPNMFVLILGRVLHGLGGGGLTSTGMVVLGDIAAPKDRGKYYGYFSATYTTAGACGPAFGGFLAEYFHWKVIFWINIPMGIVALLLVLTLLKRLPRHEQKHKLDFLGASLIMSASVAFMLALSMGGVRYPWTSPPILALLGLALVIGTGFVWRLLTAPEPLIPLAFFSSPVTRLAIAANAFGWGAIVGLHIFLPIYLQNIVGMTPFAAGLSVITLAIALNVSAGVTGTILPWLTHYKMIPAVGLTIAIAALINACLARPRRFAARVPNIAGDHRCRLRRHAAAVGHRAAEQRVDLDIRHCRRHHAILAQSLLHDDGRGIRGRRSDRPIGGRRNGLFGRRFRADLLRRRRKLRAVAARGPPGRGEAAADHPRLRCYVLIKAPLASAAGREAKA